jgi:hypothetical protein
MTTMTHKQSIKQVCKQLQPEVPTADGILSTMTPVIEATTFPGEVTDTKPVRVSKYVPPAACPANQRYHAHQASSIRDQTRLPGKVLSPPCTQRPHMAEGASETHAQQVFQDNMTERHPSNH